jgi:Mg-chelatase subunit ChlD
MTDPGYTHCSLIIDRSGSMEAVRDDAQGGINAFLREQYAQPGRLTVTLSQFDTEFDSPARMATEPVGYQLNPRGGTALLDAVGMEVLATGRDLAALDEPQRPGRVLLLVVTDGEENSSHEFTLERVREMLAEQRDRYNWQVQFIGAGESSWQGEALGVATTQYVGTKKGNRAMYAAMSDAVSAYRAAPAPAAVFDLAESIPESDD